MSKQNDDFSIGDVTTQVGHPIHVSFNEAAGAGFQWACEPCENIDISSQIISDEGESIGGAVTRAFTAIARKEGNYVLTFNYRKAGQSEDAARVKLALNITP